MNRDNTTDQQLKLTGLEDEFVAKTQAPPSNLVHFSLAKKEILQEKRTKALEAIERLSKDLKEM